MISKDYYKVLKKDFLKEDLTISQFLEKEGIDKLYHVSKLPYKLEELIPQIPETRLEDEDGKTPRVCLSTSVLNCINGIDILNYVYNNMNDENYTDNFDITSFYLSVYEIDINDLNLDKLISYPELYMNNLVFDAPNFEEFWYKDSIQKFKHYGIRITDYGIKCPDDLWEYEGFNTLKESKNLESLEAKESELLNNSMYFFYLKIYGHEIASFIEYDKYNSISYNEFLKLKSISKTSDDIYYIDSNAVK